MHPGLAPPRPLSPSILDRPLLRAACDVAIAPSRGIDCRGGCNDDCSEDGSSDDADVDDDYGK
eukprot:4912235-Pyramimonas_sp.AAC.1